MTSQIAGAKMTHMSEPESDRVLLGKKLERAVEERKADKLSVMALCRLAGLTTPTYYNAVKGEASLETYRTFDEALSEWDQFPADRPAVTHEDVIVTDLPGGLVSIEFDGVTSARLNIRRVVAKGPVEGAETWMEAVQNVLARVGEQDDAPEVGDVVDDSA